MFFGFPCVYVSVMAYWKFVNVMCYETLEGISQNYNFGTQGDKDELFRFWGQMCFKIYFWGHFVTRED